MCSILQLEPVVRLAPDEALLAAGPSEPRVAPSRMRHVCRWLAAQRSGQWLAAVAGFELLALAAFPFGCTKFPPSREGTACTRRTARVWPEAFS